jgi:hypothetical protein
MLYLCDLVFKPFLLFFFKTIHRIAEKTCNAVVSKALNGKTSAVLKATDVLLAFIELEQGDKVMVTARTNSTTH